MLTFTTSDAPALLKAFDDAIAKGHITTWSHDSSYYGHKAERWEHKAFFNAALGPGVLKFKLTLVGGNLRQYEGRPVFSYYHGHLIETFATHFYYRYTNATASSVPVEDETKIP